MGEDEKGACVRWFDTPGGNDAMRQLRCGGDIQAAMYFLVKGLKQKLSLFKGRR